jgi:hypothetical protein
MSVAWYIVLERRIPGFDSFVNGKSLARMGEMLDSIAKERGVRPLMGFFSASPEELTGLAEDHGVTLHRSLPPEKWFSADEGLQTVKTMIEEGEKRKLDTRILADLREFQNVLEAAKQNGVGWHLAVDF